MNCSGVYVTIPEKKKNYFHLIMPGLSVRSTVCLVAFQGWRSIDGSSEIYAASPE